MPPQKLHGGEGEGGGAITCGISAITEAEAMFRFNRRIEHTLRLSLALWRGRYVAPETNAV